MENIIKKYNISFENKIHEFFGKKLIRKIIHVNNAVLSEFLNDWNADQIERLLLPDIEEALANSDAELENGSSTVYIYIYHQKVEFYKNNIDELAYEMPTTDFKEVALICRNFFNTPPYNLTEV